MRRSALSSLILLVTAIPLAGCHKQAAEAPQATAPQTAAQTGTAPPAGKEAYTVSRDAAGKAAPEAKIDDLGSGQPIDLRSFKGKPLLVNLWATWCGPCVRELPTLDALAKQKGDALAVVAISEDMQGQTVVLPYLQKAGLTLHPYHDRDNALMLATGEASLPVTILYGADGKEKWRIAGGLDWSGDKAKALLAEAGA